MNFDKPDRIVLRACALDITTAVLIGLALAYLALEYFS